MFFSLLTKLIFYRGGTSLPGARLGRASVTGATDTKTKSTPGFFPILSSPRRLPLDRVIHAVQLVQLQRHHHV